MIIFLTGYPQVGKTTLCELVKKHNSMRIVDVTSPIHHHVFAHYNITDPKLQFNLLTGMKDMPFWCFGDRTFRDECIRMGSFMGDRYWMDNVVFKFLEEPSVPLLASSVKNVWQIEYVAKRVNLPITDMKICSIHRPGYHKSDNCRETLPADFSLCNEGIPEELHQKFIIKINELVQPECEQRRSD